LRVVFQRVWGDFSLYQAADDQQLWTLSKILGMGTMGPRVWLEVLGRSVALSKKGMDTPENGRFQWEDHHKALDVGGFPRNF